ncbi:MAG: hypothetical protein Q7U60_10290, partial [Candidatus Methanoperedens sp.]|nr:hypothetical protein [Candidatus Methanoperedens sp.]
MRQFTPQTRMPTGIRGYRIKRGVAFQTRGMQSIPQHHVNRGIGLRGYAIDWRDSRFSSFAVIEVES